MSELKFTPGPWRVAKDSWGRIEIESDNARDNADESQVFVLARNIGGRVHGESFDDFSEVEANVKLIAAAPDLWKALERIARPHDCGCVPCTGSCTSEMALQITVDEMRELARAAIAKATA